MEVREGEGSGGRGFSGDMVDRRIKQERRVGEKRKDMKHDGKRRYGGNVTAVGRMDYPKRVGDDEQTTRHNGGVK